MRVRGPGLVEIEMVEWKMRRGASRASTERAIVSFAGWAKAEEAKRSERAAARRRGFIAGSRGSGAQCTERRTREEQRSRGTQRGERGEGLFRLLFSLRSLLPLPSEFGLSTTIRRERYRIVPRFGRGGGRGVPVVRVQPARDARRGVPGVRGGGGLRGVQEAWAAGADVPVGAGRGVSRRDGGADGADPDAGAGAQARPRPGDRRGGGGVGGGVRGRAGVAGAAGERGVVAR